MESSHLYKVKKKDFSRLDQILTECFQNDPLYSALIPDAELRKKLLPELFQCDLEEMFANCEIFSDGPEINSILVVSDESETYNHIMFHLIEMFAELKTEGYLIKEDPSFKTLWNFIEGKEYLNSVWTDELPEKERIHIIYLAVSPNMQHHDISSKLVNEVIAYAQANNLMISLETHNEKNVNFYKHFGFEIFEVVEKCFHLKQYCMIRRTNNTNSTLTQNNYPPA